MSGLMRNPKAWGGRDYGYKSEAVKMNVWTDYEAEVRMLEVQGVSRGDAQAVVDIEFNRRYGVGWERRA